MILKNSIITKGVQDFTRKLIQKSVLKSLSRIAKPPVPEKKIEAKIAERHPDKWMPLYSQVTFSHIPYSEAHAQGIKQEEIMKNIMQHPKINENWDSNEIEQQILKQQKLS